MSTIKVDTVRPVTTDADLTLQGDASGAGVTGAKIFGDGSLGADSITDLAGTGAPNFPNGLILASNAIAGNITGVTLDDYEEGTFTPTYFFDGGGTVTVTSNTGLYVKVGDLVHCAFKIRSTGVSGVSGNLYIGGFPFTAVSDSRSAGSKWFARSWGADMPNFSFGVQSGTTNASVYRNAMNASADAVDTSDFNTGSDSNVLEASITYRVA